jgi:ferredoxin
MAKDSVQTAPVEAQEAPLPAAPVPGLPRQILATGDSPEKSTDTLRSLLNFHRHGQRVDSAAADTGDVWPALLHPFRDMRNIRHEFPLLISGDPRQEPVQSLSSRIDAIIDQSGLEGDPKERLRRRAYRFEAALKDALAENSVTELARLARQVGDNMLASAELEESRKTVLGHDIETVIEGLPRDAEITGNSPDLAAKLYRSVAGRYWTGHCLRWQADLEKVVHALGDMLRSDAEHKPEAKSADHLRHTLGTGRSEDLDFERMSSMLAKTRQVDALPEARSRRISEALTLLKAMLPVYGMDSDLEPPFDPALHASNVGEAVVQLNLRQIAMVEFFRALRVGELELKNQYDPAIHDHFFSQFDQTHLSPMERSLCPPVVLELGQQGLDVSAAGALLELLDSHAPIKVVLSLNSLDEDEFSGSPAWPARFAGAVMSLGSAFVFQGTSSNPDALQEAFSAGAAYPGPALFSVYTGTSAGGSRLPPYLDAASALEARTLPSYRFDPSLGAEQASRMTLMNNPRQELPWVSDVFSYFNAAGQESAMELSFTHADFLLADRRWRQEFWVLDHALQNDALLPLSEFLALDSDQQRSRVPYVLAVDKGHEIRRVVINSRVLGQVLSVGNRWRALQEAGGINNSHARNLLSAEQARMESELQTRSSELQKQTETQLDQNLGELTREIVTRIADQLISGASVQGLPARTPAPVKRSEVVAPAVSEKVVAPVEEEDEDDAPISLDEPYIDSVLCTTCDDCTKMAPHIFAYDENKQAYIKDATSGTFQELVLAAEKCPVKIIHPGKPKNPAESNLDEWIARAKPFN